MEPSTPPELADDATAALLDTFVPNVCHVCKLPGKPELHKCARCRSVWYCSRGCQAIDWKRAQGTGHKELCKPFKKLRTRINASASKRSSKISSSVHALLHGLLKMCAPPCASPLAPL